MLETVIFVLLINNNRKNQVIGGCDIEQPLAHVSRLRFCSWAVLSGIYIWDSGQCNLGHSDSLNPACVVAGSATPYYILHITPESIALPRGMPVTCLSFPSEVYLI